MGIDGLRVAGIWQPPINQVYPRISRSEYDLINLPLICIACLTACGLPRVTFTGFPSRSTLMRAGGRDEATNETENAFVWRQSKKRGPPPNPLHALLAA